MYYNGKATLGHSLLYFVIQPPRGIQNLPQKSFGLRDDPECFICAQKMPIILQPEDEVDLPETYSKSSAISVFTSRQLPSWLPLGGKGSRALGEKAKSDVCRMTESTLICFNAINVFSYEFITSIIQID